MIIRGGIYQYRVGSWVFLEGSILRIAHPWNERLTQNVQIRSPDNGAIGRAR